MTARGIQDEKLFAWWVPLTLRKRDRVIMALNSCVRKYFHKYGIDIPTSVDNVKIID